MVRFVKILIVLLITLNISACPKINGMVDYNCDGEIIITFLGDSFVSGFGDKPNYLGYVGRFALVNPYIKVNKIRKFGLTTPQLLKFVKSSFRYKDAAYDKFRESDFILVDAGRNDKWLGIEPSETANNVLRCATTIRDSSRQFAMNPFVAIARMPKTTRVLQRSFISDVNRTFDRYQKGNKINILSFSNMPTSGLSYDNLHPNRGGYIYMYETVDNYVHGVLQKYMAAKRADLDLDGIYDIPELFRFFIKVGKFDSDDDGISDFDEVFVHHTNPRVFTDINTLPIPTPSPSPTPYPAP